MLQEYTSPPEPMEVCQRSTFAFLTEVPDRHRRGSVFRG